MWEFLDDVGVNDDAFDFGTSFSNGIDFNLGGLGEGIDWGSLANDSLSSVPNIDWGGVAGGIGDSVGGASSGWLEQLLNGPNAPSLFKMGTGLVNYLQNLNQASSTRQSGEQAANRADPFGPQRARYAQMLSQMMADPTTYLNSNIPGFGAGLKSGVDQIGRINAKKGMLDSGNINYDVMDYAQKYAMDQFNTQQTALGNLAGASFNPASSGELLYKSGQDANTQNRYGLAALMRPWKDANDYNTAQNDVNDYDINMKSFLERL